MAKSSTSVHIGVEVQNKAKGQFGVVFQSGMGEVRNNGYTRESR